jgi:hypothetical protein
MRSWDGIAQVCIWKIFRPSRLVFPDRNTAPAGRDENGGRVQALFLSSTSTCRATAFSVVRTPTP